MVHPHPRPTPARARARPINPFRTLQVHRNFRLFWTGQTVSLIGTWMQQVGQGWLALELTNSAFLVGVVAAAGSFPVLLLSLYGGVIADRHSKLRIVIICQALLLIEAAALWWFTWSGQINIHWLLVLTTLGGVISAFEIPARQSLIVELVAREDLVDAIALNSGGFNLARIIGPSIAAIVLAKLGLAWCFGVNALSYLAVLGSLARIRLPGWSGSENTSRSIVQCDRLRFRWTYDPLFARAVHSSGRICPALSRSHHAGQRRAGEWDPSNRCPRRAARSRDGDLRIRLRRIHPDRVIHCWRDGALLRGAVGDFQRRRCDARVRAVGVLEVPGDQDSLTVLISMWAGDLGAIWHPQN